MSQFITTISTNLAAIVAKLPAGKFIHGVNFNKTTNELEITWEHDKLKTKHTFPTPFPVEYLDGVVLPEGITAIPRITIQCGQTEGKTVSLPVTDKAPEIIVKEKIDTKPKSVRKPKA